MKAIVIYEWKLTRLKLLLGLACILFACGCAVIIYYYFYKDIELPYFLLNIRTAIVLLPFLILLINLFLSTDAIVIDLANNRFKKRWKLGFIQIGTWQLLPEAEYLSVFKQVYTAHGARGTYETGIRYDISLWYNNQHCIISNYYTKEEALEIAKQIAAAMQRPLLDSTTPDNHTWVIVNGVAAI